MSGMQATLCAKVYSQLVLDVRIYIYIYIYGSYEKICIIRIICLDNFEVF